ncbi:MAG: tetratricopeptide repeat protein [Alphaproteobacteria bacterium]|nr:tetratricopeptide repeat protein [Alphaproteobacteria bacterium]
MWRWIGSAVVAACVMAMPSVAQTTGAPTSPGEALRLGQAAARSGLPGEAFALFLPLARAGNTRAMMELGDLYLSSLELRWNGTSPNDAEAARWFRRAADRGDREAMLRLSALYATGRGVPQDADEAARWYARAVALPPPPPTPPPAPVKEPEVALGPPYRSGHQNTTWELGRGADVDALRQQLEDFLRTRFQQDIPPS